MLRTLYRTFQKWSDGCSVWVYSDPHFGDVDCELMDPHWPAPEEQVKMINKKVGKHDTLIILGDIGDPTYLPKVHGKKILIAGNHDVGLNKYFPYFEEMYSGPLMIAEKIILSHEPLNVDWALNIHGHNHAVVHGEKGVNVCSNIIGYTPINLKDIIQSGKLKKIDSIHRQTIDTATACVLGE